MMASAVQSITTATTIMILIGVITNNIVAVVVSIQRSSRRNVTGLDGIHHRSNCFHNQCNCDTLTRGRLDVRCSSVSLSPLHSRIVCLEFYHSLSLTITAAIVSDICNVGWT